MATRGYSQTAQDHLLSFSDNRITLERLHEAVRVSAYRGRRRAWLTVAEVTPPRRDTIRMPADSYGMARRRAGE